MGGVSFYSGLTRLQGGCERFSIWFVVEEIGVDRYFLQSNGSQPRRVRLYSIMDDASRFTAAVDAGGGEVVEMEVTF